MKKISMLMLSFLLAVLVLSACGDTDESKQNAEETGEQGQEMELPEPDLEDIPDVVAEVNGEEITKEDFEGMYQQQFQMQAMQVQMSGQEIDQDKLKEQTAEGMIGQELLIQEADKRFSDVSKEDVDKMIEDLVEQNGSESKEAMFAQLEEQGIEKKELISEVESQVKVDQLIEEEAGDTSPTEDELKEAYDMLKSQQEEAGSDEEMPDFDEVKPQLEENLKGQKEAEEIEGIVGDLRKDADVTVHI